MPVLSNCAEFLTKSVYLIQLCQYNRVVSEQARSIGLKYDQLFFQQMIDRIVDFKFRCVQMTNVLDYI